MTLPPMEPLDWALLGGGAALLLGGWLLYKLALWMSGALLGAAAGYGLGTLIPLFVRIPTDNVLVFRLALAVAGLLLGILLFRTLQGIAFFLAGACLAGWGFVVAMFRLQEMGYPWAEHWAFVLLGPPGAALLGGVIAAAYSEYVIVLATCAGGTLMVLEALDWPYDWVGALILFPLGVLLQTGLGRAAIMKREEEDDE